MSNYILEGTNYGPSLWVNYTAPGQSHTGPTPVFSRASTKMVFNSSGVLTQVAINTIAEEYSPSGYGWEYRGPLIEGQRTNLLLHSQNFGVYTGQGGGTATSGTGTGLDGGTTASTIDEGSTADPYKGVYQNVTVSTGSVTHSVYVKPVTLRYFALGMYSTAANFVGAIFDLQLGTCTATTAGGTWSGQSGSIESAGGGWFRVSLSATVSAGAGVVAGFRPANAGTGFAAFGTPATYTGTNRTALLFGGQIEAGGSATSYIPTTTGSVVRSADVWQLTGSDFSSVWGASEGSIYINADTSAVGTAGILSANDNTANERVELYSSATDPKFIVVDGGVTQADIDAGAIVAKTNFKLAARYKLNDFAISEDGAAVVADTGGTIPTPTRLEIGKDQAGNYLNGHIREVKLYTTGVADAMLQRIAT